MIPKRAPDFEKILRKEELRRIERRCGEEN
jgi:hypothetical protein